jgi:hypothetical protein
MSQEKLAQAIRAYKIISIAQYAIPFVLVALALILPGIAELGESRDLVVTVLFLFAIMDFLFLRFAILPRMRATLKTLSEGQ